MKRLGHAQRRQIMKDHCILTLPGGFTLHSGGEQRRGAYVRFCDQQGREVAEWREASVD